MIHLRSCQMKNHNFWTFIDFSVRRRRENEVWRGICVPILPFIPSKKLKWMLNCSIIACIWTTFVLSIRSRGNPSNIPKENSIKLFRDNVHMIIAAYIVACIAAHLAASISRWRWFSGQDAQGARHQFPSVASPTPVFARQRDPKTSIPFPQMSFHPLSGSPPHRREYIVH